jgi:formylmethanofuran dehydrogenase subunit E
MKVESKLINCIISAKPDDDAVIPKETYLELANIEICDSCHEYIYPDEINYGFECNMCESCLNAMGQD